MTAIRLIRFLPMTVLIPSVLPMTVLIRSRGALIHPPGDSCRP
jgi:hypothetical protein